MKGTLKIATMFKIPVYLHWSFPLIFIYILIVGLHAGSSWQEMATIAALTLTVFFCVLLHEYGHALTARKYGVQTRDIILSPIGGIARLERIPDKPAEELKVALAGPAVNVVIALILLAIIYFLRKDGLYYTGESELEAIQNSDNILPLLLLVNIILVVFNMIPAFPMDGGRVLRSILAMKMDRVKATRIAYIVAQVAAVLMFLYAIYCEQYIMCFIAIFVVFTSRMEWKSVARGAVLAGKQVKDLMQPLTNKIYSNQSIQEVLESNNNEPKNYLVFDRNSEEVVGVLFHHFLEYAVKEKDLEAPVQKYLSNSWEQLSSHYPLDNAVTLFQLRGYGVVPIVEHGELIGQLDMFAINRFVRSI